jgi:hypothetical protein
MSDQNYIGYMKYKGALVEEGLLDTRKAAQALIGFDEILRFYVGRQSSQLRDVDYEIPVLIKKGSWEVQLIENIALWAAATTGIAATTYITAAAKKMADNDFGDVGLKVVFRKALEAAQWTIRIGKHIKDITKRKFKDVRFKNNNKEIGLPNDQGEYLYVPKEFFDLYMETSPKLLERVALLIERERTLLVGVIRDGEEIREEITYSSRRIFTQEDDEDELLFPELTHGLRVELEGELTRGNETSNTMGLKYRDHILTCEPVSGSIVRYKPALFLWCKMHGAISRADKFGGYNSLRPKIIFSHIEQLEKESDTDDLFKA